MPASISHALSAVAHAKTSAGTISVIIADSLSPAHLAEPASGLPELGVVAEEPKGDTQVRVRAVVTGWLVTSARAIRCACAITELVRELSLDVRACVHRGECKLVDGKGGHP